MIGTGRGFVLACFVYAAGLWFFGWRIAGRKPLPSLGWALLGCLIRWQAVVFLFPVIHLLGWVLPFRVGLALGLLMLLRIAVWGLLATGLYEATRKQALHFGVVMTLLNVGLDMLAFGPSTPDDLLRPFGSLGALECFY